MSDDAMWDGFAGAVVRIDLPDGTAAVLAPRPSGEVGRFPFESAVHIVTAYNPAGVEIDESANADRHRRLAAETAELDTVDTVGSAPDGSMPEPGVGLLSVTTEHAIALGRAFGQRAIYRWTPDALVIVGVDEPHQRALGWSLTSADGSTASAPG
jgi:hypothetical protein